MSLQELKPKNLQKGVTFIGMLLFMSMAGVIALLAINLVPLYINDFKITKMLETLKNPGETLTREEIIDRLQKRMMIEFSGQAPVPPEKLKLVSTGNLLSAQLDYETRVHIAYNIDALVVFVHHLDLH